MAVVVEFYGIPRARAGAAQVAVETSGASIRLGDLLRQLASRYPELAAACLEDGRLKRGFAANVGGQRFVSDPNTPLLAGECLLITSADAGG